MVNGRRKEVIAKAKEMAGAGSDATGLALSTGAQMSARSLSPEHMGSRGDAGKHCLGQCPDLKLLAAWPIRPVELQLYHQEEAGQP